MNRLQTFIVTALLLGLPMTSQAALITATYVGLDGGSWNVASNWTRVGVPNNGGNTFHAVINSNASLVDVFLNGSVTIDQLTVDAGDSLTVNNGVQLIIDGNNGGSAGTVTNAGTITVGSAGAHTYIMPQDGPITLTGGGTLVFSDHTNNWMYKASAGGSFVNLNNTIQGAGNFGWGGSPTAISNGGTIIANGVNPLVIATGGAGLVNTNTVRADNGGTLQLHGGPYTNTGGLIEALNNSFVDLYNGAEITGGTLDTTGTGVIRAFNGSSRITDVANTGLVRVFNDRFLRVSGTINNSGTIELASTGGNTYLRPQGGMVTLTGGGTILLSNNTLNWIYRDDAAGALTNVNNTIQGAGHLGWAGSPMPITNQALVLANVSNPLIVEPASQTFTNTGTMRADNGGTLQLLGGPYTNTGGLIEALNNSFVDLYHAANITGGTLDTTGTGLVRAVNGTPRINDLANTGLLRVLNGITLQLGGTINNSGTIELNSSGFDTYLRPLGGAVNLTGGGMVILSDHVNNWIMEGDGLASFVNVNNTIQGAGHLGWTGAPMPITNQGTVIANGVNPLSIEPGGAAVDVFTNSGTIQVTGTGGLQIQSGQFAQQGSVIINAGRTLTRVGNYNQTAGSTLVNGNLVLQSGGAFQLAGGSLKGSGTVAGAVVSNTGGNVQPGSSAGALTVLGNYSQSGGGTLEIEIGGASPGTQHDVLAVNGTATLAGTLKVTLINGFNPAVDQEFQIMQAGTLSGQFRALDAPPGFCIIYQGNNIKVKLEDDTCAPDITCDGQVTVEDLLAVINAWGACSNNPCPPSCLSDIAPAAGNCLVNVDDLLLVINGWGPCP